MTGNGNTPIGGPDDARFRALVESRGADPARWPAEDRAWAERVAATDATATALLAEEAALDRLLDQAPAPAVPGDLVGRVLAAAPGRGASGLSGWLWPARHTWKNLWRPLGGLAVALFLGVAVGAMTPPELAGIAQAGEIEDLSLLDTDAPALSGGETDGSDGTSGGPSRGASE